MAFSIPIYRVSDVHADKQPSTRGVLPLTPSPTTASSSSSYSSGHLEVSHYTKRHEADHHSRQPLKQSPSSYRCNTSNYNNKRRYGSITDHQNAAFLDSSGPSTARSIRNDDDDTASIRSVSSSGSEASFKTATTTTAAEAAAAKFANTQLDMPPTPPHTTVSPNDNDEGLYLLWTHQLLRERGFKPPPCRLKENDVDVLAKQDVTGHDENNYQHHRLGRHDNDEDKEEEEEEEEDEDDSDDSRSTDSSLTDGDNDKESSLLLTTPDIADYGSRMQMYSSFNSCASSFTGSRSQQPEYFHHRPSAASSSMHLSAAARHAAEDEDEQDKPLSFFASFFGACFSCRR